MVFPRKRTRWLRAGACVLFPLSVLLGGALSNVTKDCLLDRGPQIARPGFVTVVFGYESVYAYGWPMLCYVTTEYSLSPTARPYRTGFLYFSHYGVVVNASIVLILSGCTAVIAYRAACGRRGLQFSLGGLLAFTTVIAILLGLARGSQTLSELVSTPPYIWAPLILGIVCAVATGAGFARWLLGRAWNILLALGNRGRQ